MTPRRGVGPGTGGQALCRGVGVSSHCHPLPACWGLCPSPPPLVPPSRAQEPFPCPHPAPPPAPLCPRGGWGTPARLRGVGAGDTPEQGAVGDDEDGGCLQGMGGVTGNESSAENAGGSQGMREICGEWPWGAPPDPHLPRGVTAPHPRAPPGGLWLPPTCTWVGAGPWGCPGPPGAPGRAVRER